MFLLGLLRWRASSCFKHHTESGCTESNADAECAASAPKTTSELLRERESVFFFPLFILYFVAFREENLACRWVVAVKERTPKTHGMATRAEKRCSSNGISCSDVAAFVKRECGEDGHLQHAAMWRVVAVCCVVEVKVTSLHLTLLAHHHLSLFLASFFCRASTRTML